jgi:hypothetical protein
VRFVEFSAGGFGVSEYLEAIPLSANAGAEDNVVIRIRGVNKLLFFMALPA